MSKIPNWYDELLEAIRHLFAVIDALIADPPDTRKLEPAERKIAEEKEKVRLRPSFWSVELEPKTFTAQTVTSTDLKTGKDVKESKGYKASMLHSSVGFANIILWLVGYTKVDGTIPIPSFIQNMREKHVAGGKPDYAAILGDLLRTDINKRIKLVATRLETKQTARNRLLAQQETISAMSTTLHTTRDKLVSLGEAGVVAWKSVCDTDSAAATLEEAIQAELKAEEELKKWAEAELDAEDAEDAVA